MITKIVNLRKEKYDVYIGRPSKWGNPFIVGRDGARGECADKYREWIVNGNGRHLLKDIGELKGKVLGCYCKPNKCHGDVLVELCEACQ
jgi:hypothetical protein